MTLGTATWTQTSATCAVPITYSLLDRNTGLTANGIFSIDGSNNILVTTSNPSDAALYNLKLEGNIVGYTSS